jgi:hypothetical protein
VKNTPPSPKQKPAKPIEDVIGAGFKNVLDSHGYSFQEAVVRAISQVGSPSAWTPWVPEFPVQIHGHSTRIDLVLTNRTNRIYLVCECKRANPAIANWCFARSSYHANVGLSQQSYLEVLQRQHGGAIACTIRELLHSSRLYQIAVEVKGQIRKGDKFGQGRGQIEDAATQVCRGLNGLIQACYTKGLPRLGVDTWSFLPVIITTANLWATDTDLSLASIETGKLEEASVAVRSIPWLWYQYPQSPGLKHSVPNNFGSHDLRDILYY